MNSSNGRSPYPSQRTVEGPDRFSYRPITSARGEQAGAGVSGGVQSHEGGVLPEEVPEGAVLQGRYADYYTPLASDGGVDVLDYRIYGDSGLDPRKHESVYLIPANDTINSGAFGRALWEKAAAAATSSQTAGGSEAPRTEDRSDAGDRDQNHPSHSHRPADSPTEESGLSEQSPSPMFISTDEDGPDEVLGIELTDDDDEPEVQDQSSKPPLDILGLVLATILGTATAIVFGMYLKALGVLTAGAGLLLLYMYLRQGDRQDRVFAIMGLGLLFTALNFFGVLPFL